MRRIQEILEERRRKNERDLKNRQREVYSKIPRILNIEKELKKINSEIFIKKLKNESTELLNKKIDILYKEKDELLLKNGFELDYLNKKYHCNICKDTGVNGTKICNCKRQLMIEEAYSNFELKDLLEKQNFNTFNLNKFRKSVQSNERISPYENMKNLKEELYFYAKNFDINSQNIFIYGNSGTGKTFLLSCIAKEVLNQGNTVIYADERDIITTIISYTYSNFKDKEEYKSKVDMIYNSDLLIIDDLGTGNITGNTTSALFEVINKRLRRGLPVIISSNLNIEDLDKFYGKRIFSRILGSYYIKETFGDDLRIESWK